MIRRLLLVAALTLPIATNAEVRLLRHPSYSKGKVAFSYLGDIWVVDLATRKARRLIRNGTNPKWSPDGKRIVFERGRDTAYIYIARTDGTGQRRVTEGSSAIWAPSGDEIAFIGANPRRHYYDAVVRMARRI